MNLPFIVLFLAALVHVSAYVLLARRIEPFMYNFYIVAWWSYIAMADAALALKSKRFLVFNRNLPFLVVLSAAFWCVFELINLRIQNWYYINIPSIGLIRFVGYLLAYGTVIPGIYVTKEAFSALLGSIRVRPLSLRFNTNLHSCGRPSLRPGTPGGSEEPHPQAGTRAYSEVRRGERRSDNKGIHVKANWYSPASCMALGLLLFVILMFFPSQFFFLAWIFLIPIIDGYSYAKGRWCFMGDLERGEAGNLISSVLSGLVCGLLWETWNYWAISKWVYSIPSFETFKLFEMPILGYFGFVFFSLETILFISFIHESQLVRRHRPWTAIIALTFSLASFAAIDRYTVFSYTATVDQLSFLPQYEREELKRKGIETSFAIDPQQLNQEEKASLALLHLKGLGPANLEKLRQRGIKSVPELARMTEEELSNAIGEKNKWRLRVYLRAARQYRPQ